MSKRGFFSKDKDESTTDADAAAADAGANAVGDAPDAEPRPATSGKLVPPHGETNPETVGTTEVNPHNEAAAQRPATLPNDVVHGHIAGQPVAGDLDKLDDAGRLAYVRGFAREARARGHVSSADWELFDKILGEDPEQKRVREAQAEAQRKALSGERDGDALARRPGESDADYEARKLSAHEAKQADRPARDRP